MNDKRTQNITLLTYYMAVSGYKAAANGIVPDYKIEYTIDDLLAGTDKDTTTALRLARKD